MIDIFYVGTLPTPTFFHNKKNGKYAAYSQAVSVPVSHNLISNAQETHSSIYPRSILLEY